MSIYSVAADCRPGARRDRGRGPLRSREWLRPGWPHLLHRCGEGIAAVDVSDPHHPRTLWQGNVFAHGLNVSDDGNTLYDADPIDGDLILLDVSQIQRRVPHPVVREISRLRRPTVCSSSTSSPFASIRRP